MKYLLLFFLVIALTILFFYVSNNKPNTPYSYYFSEQDGDIFILLHGIPGNQETFTLMRDELESAGKKVLVPHLVGSTIKKDIHYVSSLLQELAITNATLVVHDRGGLVGIGLLDQHKEIFSRVVLLDTILERFDAPFTQNIVGSSLTSVLYSNTRIGVSMLEATLDQGGIEDATSMGSRDLNHVRNFFTNFTEVYEQIKKNKGYLNNYSGEILIFWGEHDPFLPKELHLKNIASIVPDNEIVILENAKHYIQHTHAKEIVERIIN